MDERADLGRRLVAVVDLAVGGQRTAPRGESGADIDHPPLVAGGRFRAVRGHARVPAVGPARPDPARQEALPGKVVESLKEGRAAQVGEHLARSDEHTSELQSLLHNSSAVYCLKHKTNTINK